MKPKKKGWLNSGFKVFSNLGLTSNKAPNP